MHPPFTNLSQFPKDVSHKSQELSDSHEAVDKPQSTRSGPKAIEITVQIGLSELE